jgi:nitronate monooxygenase
MDLCTLLGIELPIIQAPMAGVQGSALAIAVSNAGGLGSLPGAMLTPAALQRELAQLRTHTTKPFNVNFFCHMQPQPDQAREEAWRAQLAPYYAEFGIELPAHDAVASRHPFSEEVADLLSAVAPAVVSFHFGLPHPDLLARVRGFGAKILASATTVAEARWLAAHGADAIIAQGIEAGGHRGMFLNSDLNSQIGTLALVPQIVQAVRLPVIAAGGIADAKGVRAALALGAAGVQVGTSYLLCHEATTSAVHRQSLMSAAAQQTALTNLLSGRAARGIINRLMRELGPLNEQVPAFPLASAALAPLRAAAAISRPSGPARIPLAAARSAPLNRPAPWRWGSS